jgi:hypothetical protein
MEWKNGIKFEAIKKALQDIQEDYNRALSNFVISDLHMKAM